MNLTIEITEQDLKELIIKEIQRRVGDVPVQSKDVSVLVKSKQNYRAEWEEASFRATFKLNSL